MSQSQPRQNVQDLAVQMVGDLSGILAARGQNHGDYSGYVVAFQVMLNMVLEKKLKRRISRREISVIMLAHKLARLANAHEGADVQDSFMDVAGYATLGAAMEKMEGAGKDA